MAKLYWRVKKGTKWTWKPVVWVDHEKDSIQELIDELRILPPEEEE
jgi:ribosome assembly protein YihI (activator of Der GTPase)